MERCVEYPDYRIRSTYSPEEVLCKVFFGRQVLGYTNDLEKARAKALEHLASSSTADTKSEQPAA